MTQKTKPAATAPEGYFGLSKHECAKVLLKVVAVTTIIYCCLGCYLFCELEDAYTSVRTLPKFVEVYKSDVEEAADRLGVSQPRGDAKEWIERNLDNSNLDALNNQSSNSDTGLSNEIGSNRTILDRLTGKYNNRLWMISPEPQDIGIIAADLCNQHLTGTEEDKKKRRKYEELFLSLLFATQADENVRSSRWWGSVFIGPIQFLILLCFVGAVAIMLTRWSKLRCSRTKADLREKLDRLKELDGGGHNEFANACYQIKVSEMETRWLIHYLARALPALGFIGTVWGISQGLSHADLIVRATPGVEQASAVYNVASKLGVAFTTTFLALVLGLIVSFFDSIQGFKERALIDSYMTSLQTNEPPGNKEKKGKEGDG